MSAKPEPNPVIQKIVTALIGLGMLGFAVYMFIEPASPFGSTQTTGRKGGFIMTVLDWIWGVSGGIVLALLGLLIVAGLFMKPQEEGGTEPAANDV